MLSNYLFLYLKVINICMPTNIDFMQNLTGLSQLSTFKNQMEGIVVDLQKTSNIIICSIFSAFLLS